jgi:hypothetical protein
MKPSPTGPTREGQPSSSPPTPQLSLSLWQPGATCHILLPPTAPSSSMGTAARGTAPTPSFSRDPSALSLLEPPIPLLYPLSFPVGETTVGAFNSRAKAHGCRRRSSSDSGSVEASVLPLPPYYSPLSLAHILTTSSGTFPRRITL